ncbi:MAG TPA: NAD(P)/FAD-dependent oxidoreductase [Anaerolineae bacterium]|nr:NAD(P)/FAD-dependent oxidoreductase [Anaerolineae bacterium]HPL27962.1 NAD(P)/FAD-dependent oxidoreductase [Anaerolineae bacterium]
METVVIGSGLSGLTAACSLAQAGHHVTVFEQGANIGGVAATLRRDGFGWDLGPLNVEGFGPGEPVQGVLSALGLAGRVRTMRADRGIVFPDFALWKPEVYAGPYWRRERLKALFPEEAGGIDAYYRFYDRMLDLAALAKRAEAAHGPRRLLAQLRLALTFLPLRRMSAWSATQVLDHFFARPELKALYSGILADFVVRPSQFQGLGIPFVNVEQAFDRRMPLDISPAGPRPSFSAILGGCGTLVEALAGGLRQAGGAIHSGVAVERILLEDGRARGVALAGGQTAAADLVVASGGARETFFGLLDRERLPEPLATRVDEVQLMESVLMVHVGTDLDPRPYQPGELGYYYGSYDIEGAVDRVQAGDYHEGRDGFLIYVPSLHSPELAPVGHHAVTVYTVAPDRLREGTWAERGEELADTLLACAERIVPGLRAHTRARVVLTPDDFRVLTHLRHHSFGGCSPVMGKPGAPHHTGIPGLWFVGAQSESAGGVANVITGAYKTAQLVLEECAAQRA